MKILIGGLGLFLVFILAFRSVKAEDKGIPVSMDIVSYSNVYSYEFRPDEILFVDKITLNYTENNSKVQTIITSTRKFIPMSLLNFTSTHIITDFKGFSENYTEIEPGIMIGSLIEIDVWMHFIQRNYLPIIAHPTS